jgi:hypothetical protein
MLLFSGFMMAANVAILQLSDGRQCCYSPALLWQPMLLFSNIMTAANVAILQLYDGSQCCYSPTL